MQLLKPNLDKLEEQGNVEKICEIALNTFKRNDTDTCFEAVCALERLADPRANQVLIFIVENWLQLDTGKHIYAGQVRETAWAALASSGDARIIQPLAGILWKTWTPEGSTKEDLAYFIKLVLSVEDEAEDHLLEFLQDGYKKYHQTTGDERIHKNLLGILGAVGGERSLEYLERFYGVGPLDPNPAIDAIAMIKKRMRKKKRGQ